MADEMETEPMLIDVYSFWLLGNNEKPIISKCFMAVSPSVAEIERCDE